jgi:hypothetical protein
MDTVAERYLMFSFTNDTLMQTGLVKGLYHILNILIVVYPQIWLNVKYILQINNFNFQL